MPSENLSPTVIERELANLRNPRSSSCARAGAPCHLFSIFFKLRSHYRSQG